MRFTQRQHTLTDKRYANAMWHDWFAWYPVRITHCVHEEEQAKINPHRTPSACADARPLVWLETVERRVRYIRGCLDYQYRFKE